MIELIFLIILILSLAGIVFILYRKMPLLVQTTESSEGFQKAVMSKIKEKTKDLPGLKDFDHELYLQKLLSKFRVLTLKTEHKTSSWLEHLRQKNVQNSNNDNYWEELKKAKDGK